MKLLLLILGIVVIGLNLFLWYSKRQANHTKAHASSGHKAKLDEPSAGFKEFSNQTDLDALKQSAAAELGISIEALEHMSVEEIEELATRKGLIRLTDTTS